MTHRYGNFALQLNDSDADKRWGGSPQTALPAANHVRRLQEDLIRLGFTTIGEPTGVFDLFTEWAVREFQIAAKSDYVAIEDVGHENTIYHARLSRIQNPSPYPSSQPISGRVNVETEQRIALWLRDFLRCPLLIVPGDGATPPSGSEPRYYTQEFEVAGSPTGGTIQLTIEGNTFGVPFRWPANNSASREQTLTAI